ncbi:DUF350 domain-containing protein [Corynebacterium glutamicum]|uniref:DUF350 domain-containing protein n=2 Tax=Corynebacterium glutamicum TaxID=1718 RepID=A0AB36IF77_CORGT|nr:DUF350 domain-containing protein [Corynebacterium glutamicum]AGN20220.1 hypothetical protein C624_13265 [Corynebacterium glutamicum SCgG1]AGN23244.1 hypothetical protein C629_13270 [Corynebacterium glutamicum SCgG2]EGV41901.1 hypothetical protein CgS9114_00750 [Corynebacterium glutamicum S9114]EOA64800.1 hypothetical protein J433_08460 [Corynebacterium glutamicum MT]EPP39649.1 hypothetical protein A583_12804 [Corynebacterium glutamicum Z188]
MSQYLVDGVIGTLSYFVLATVILVVGFVILDLITPGKLHELVFVHHLPNAAVITVAQQVSIGIIVVTAVLTSSDILSEGLLETAVFGALGLVIQVVVMAVLEAVIPGRFRDLVEDPKLRSGAVVAAVILIVVGTVNAACLI